MDKADFEAAIVSAVNAPSNDGTKWRRFERLFSSEGLRAGGAISNQHAEQVTRVRQLMTTRPYPGGRAHGQYCVFVLNADQAARHRADPTGTLESVLRALRTERNKYLPPDEGIESVLIVRIDKGKVVPIAQVKWGSSATTAKIASWYPAMQSVDLSGELRVTTGATAKAPAKPVAATATSKSKMPGENRIYFGPPGTGKSYKLKKATSDFADVISTAFHPEYTYGDFVGSYKPVCGQDPSEEIVSYDTQTKIARPVIYYTFDPGVLLRAVVRAHKDPSSPVALVIDELNRGDCAAIFGDFLHLLDRDDSGSSEYGIHVGKAAATYLVENGVLANDESKLHLPSNLHIYATMNTSDQALFPMDSAFKRRWSWEAVAVEADKELSKVVVPAVGSSPAVPWLEFIGKLNDVIIARTGSEDKRIGPWFIRARDGEIPVADFRNKLLYYLWHDVFRGYTADVFDPSLRAFDDLQRAFDVGGVVAILPSLYEEDAALLSDETDADDGSTVDAPTQSEA